MTNSPRILEQQGIFLVLVLYKRGLHEVVSWPVIVAWLTAKQRTPIRHCLIYDNSPSSYVDHSLLPANASLICNPNNGGTANAYIAGADCAIRRECDWLLLVDQDTALPPEYLDRAEAAVSAIPNAIALVPRVSHGSRLVSPATITSWGSVSPSQIRETKRGMTTAISSGILIRRDVIADIDFPPEVWLDYVDHWIFRELSKLCAKIGVIDINLSHDLSVRTPAKLSTDRLSSILVAEATFYRTLGKRARIALPIRRMIRALRYFTLGRPDLSVMVMREITNQTQSKSKPK